ncbi:MAG: hypothetical protein WD423_10415 [Rhodothermales bacterium]
MESTPRYPSHLVAKRSVREDQYAFVTPGRQRASRLLCCILCGFCLICLGTSVAAAQAYRTIAVDLSSGAMKSAVPFDVPFRVRGAVTDQVTGVSVWIVEKPDVRSAPFDADTWRNVDNWSRFEGAAGDSFYVHVPALEANSFYQFHFVYRRSPTSGELQAFHARARSAVDRFMRRQSADAIGDVQAFQQSLVSALPRPAGASGMTVAAEPGSIFDTTSTSGRARLRSEMARLLTPQADLDAARRNAMSGPLPDDFDGDGEPDPSYFDLVRPRMDAPAGDSTLVTIAEEIRALAAQDAALQPHVSSAVTLGLLADLSSEERTRVLTGQDPLTSVRAAAFRVTAPLDEVWAPDSIDARLDNLERTRRALRGAASLLRRLSRDVALRDLSPRLARQPPAHLEQLFDRVAYLGDGIEGLAGHHLQIRRALEQRNAVLDELVDDLSIHARYGMTVTGSSGGTFETRARWYLSADVGLAAVPVLDEVLPYFGMNVYFRPVNKEAPLSARGGIGRRFAALIGVTYASVEKTDERADLFGSNALLVGGGLRLTDVLRVSAGALVYKGNDPRAPAAGASQPDFELSRAFFFSVSFDWDVRQTLGVLGSAITK